MTDRPEIDYLLSELPNYGIDAANLLNDNIARIELLKTHLYRPGALEPLFKVPRLEVEQPADYLPALHQVMA